MTTRPAWWPTAEQKAHADAGCAHPDECKLLARTAAERDFWDEHGFWPDDTRAMAYCVCLFSCSDDRATACSLSGEWHVHPNRWPGDVMGPCPVHPDAPGDL